jgi:ClpP class serine protease
VVGGLFDLVDQIRAIKAGTDKPIWAVANESALSAAYAVASTADRLYVTQTGELGSIGVMAVHVDESAADAKAGLAWTFVFAGESKADGNAHEPLSARARATIQADVDRLYAQLCGLVAANRGLTNETVRGTDAGVYRGEFAIRARLADRLGALDQRAPQAVSCVLQGGRPADLSSGVRLAVSALSIVCRGNQRRENVDLHALASARLCANHRAGVCCSAALRR